MSKSIEKVIFRYIQLQFKQDQDNTKRYIMWHLNIFWVFLLNISNAHFDEWDSKIDFLQNNGFSCIYYFSQYRIPRCIPIGVSNISCEIHLYNEFMYTDNCLSQYLNVRSFKLIYAMGLICLRQPIKVISLSLCRQLKYIINKSVPNILGVLFECGVFSKIVCVNLYNFSLNF